MGTGMRGSEKSRHQESAHLWKPSTSKHSLSNTYLFEECPSLIFFFFFFQPSSTSVSNPTALVASSAFLTLPQKSSRLGPTVVYTPSLAPTLHAPPDIHPWFTSTLVWTHSQTPMWHTLLTGPLLWFIAVYLQPRTREQQEERLPQLPKFPDMMVKQFFCSSMGEEKVQTLQLLHRPNPKLCKPDLTTKANSDQQGRSCPLSA